MRKAQHNFNSHARQVANATQSHEGRGAHSRVVRCMTHRFEEREVPSHRIHPVWGQHNDTRSEMRGCWPAQSASVTSVSFLVGLQVITGIIVGQKVLQGSQSLSGFPSQMRCKWRRVATWRVPTRECPWLTQGTDSLTACFRAENVVHRTFLL